MSVWMKLLLMFFIWFILIVLLWLIVWIWYDLQVQFNRLNTFFLIDFIDIMPRNHSLFFSFVDEYQQQKFRKQQKQENSKFIINKQFNSKSQMSFSFVILSNFFYWTFWCFESFQQNTEYTPRHHYVINHQTFLCFE